MKKKFTWILGILSGLFAFLMIFVFIWKIKNRHQPGLADMIDVKVIVFYFALCIFIFVNCINAIPHKDSTKDVPSDPSSEYIKHPKEY